MQKSYSISFFMIQLFSCHFNFKSMIDGTFHTMGVLGGLLWLRLCVCLCLLLADAGARAAPLVGAQYDALRQFRNALPQLDAEEFPLWAKDADCPTSGYAACDDAGNLRSM